MTKRVLVTGGTGYIGSVLCKQLNSTGYPVSILDKPNDVRDETVVKQYLKDVDVIVLLASIVGEGACKLDPKLAKEVNVDSVRLINRLRRKTQLVIYASTETASNPMSLYARTKAKAEEELIGSPNVIILRLASIFGISPKMRIDFLLNYFVYTALTQKSIIVFDNDARRNYAHVADVADWIIYCINNPKKFIGKKHYLAVDNLSKMELAIKIKMYIPGVSVEFIHGQGRVDERSYKPVLQSHFIAKRSIDTGIKELIKSYG